MSVVAAAVIGSAVVGGAVASKSASKAARAQDKASRRASDTELAMFDQNREDMSPFREAGVGALGKLQTGLGINNQSNFDEAAYLAARPDAAEWLKIKGPEGYTAFDHYELDGARQPGAFKQGPGFNDFNRDFSLADFQKDPGYEFRLNEGTQALDRSASARGGMFSGAQLKDLTRYNQDYASQEYGNAYNRFNNDRSQRFNRLSSLAGTGQTATNNIATLGTRAAGQVASNMIGAGNARASSYLAQGNQFQNILNHGVSAWGDRRNSNDMWAANNSADPIGSLGQSRNWWGK